METKQKKHKSEEIQEGQTILLECRLHLLHPVERLIVQNCIKGGLQPVLVEPHRVKWVKRDCMDLLDILDVRI